MQTNNEEKNVQENLLKDDLDTVSKAGSHTITEQQLLLIEAFMC